jgi:hypothetical protein
MNERIKELVEQATSRPHRSQGFGGEPTHIYPGTLDPEKFAELIVRDYAKQLVQANMSNHWYVQAMDEYYEQKWAHRFD